MDSCSVWSWYNQLVSEDITKGKAITGTGTIDHKGNVGRIGGIEMKVMAADRMGAEIFLFPMILLALILPSINRCACALTTMRALRASIKIKSKMKNRPCQNLQRALNYLREME